MAVILHLGLRAHLPSRLTVATSSQHNILITQINSDG